MLIFVLGHEARGVWFGDQGSVRPPSPGRGSRTQNRFYWTLALGEPCIWVRVRVAGVSVLGSQWLTSLGWVRQQPVERWIE